MITIRSSAFGPGQPIPKQYTGEGADLSPPLTWTGVPDSAKELALICDDPDAPTPQPWVHWVLYKLPGDCEGLEEDSNGGGAEGQNDFGNRGYGGPMPPPGHGVHHYHFKLYALDAPLGLDPGATKAAVEEAMADHILDEGELIGTYER